jgi:hypothetical protein
MTTAKAIELVREELTRAQHAHHGFHSGHEGYAVIREELDELWDAIKTTKGYTTYDGRVGYEAVQTAAMALRFLVDLCDGDALESHIEGRLVRA